MRYVKFYKKNTQSLFDLNCDSKFIDPMFWKRVHKHLTPHKIYKSTKYKIHQVVYSVNTLSIMNIVDGKKIIKESRFSYIRPSDGVTRLKLCNYSNITWLENVVHKGAQVVVEIPTGCLILFTGDNCHAGVSTFRKEDGSYLSNLRLSGYIVEKEYITGNEDITSIQQNMFVNIIVILVRICSIKIFIIQVIYFNIL